MKTTKAPCKSNPQSPLARKAGLAKKQFPLYMILLLPMVVYIMFRYVPMTKIVWAFTNLGDVAKSRVSYVGWKNFQELFATKGFKRALVNTLIISFYNMLFSFPIPILIALILNEIRCKWFKKATQTIIYLPHFLSWAIIGSIFFLILAPQKSPNAQLAEMLQMEPIYWFSSLDHIRSVLVFTNVWKSAGYGAIVYLAALSGVDPALYEAATMDGANKMQRIKNISLPCIRPIVITMLILNLAGILNIFDQVLVMAPEITYSKVDVIQTYAYRTGIEQMRLAYGMAVSIVTGAVSMILVLSTNWLAKRVSNGEEGIF